MIGRAYIAGSKSVAMNAWPPQGSYPCGNFPDTSFFKLRTWGEPPHNRRRLRQLRVYECLRAQRDTQPLPHPLPLPLLQRLELWQNEKNMEKPWETHLQARTENPFEKTFFFWPGLCSEKKVAKKILLSDSTLVWNIFFWGRKHFSDENEKMIAWEIPVFLKVGSFFWKGQQEIWLEWG